MLSVPQRLFGRLIPIASISDEVRPISGTLMRKYFIVRYHFQIFMFLNQIFMFNHDFADRSLFLEVKLIDSLIEKLCVDVVKRDYYLSADRLYCRLIIRCAGINSLSNVLETLDVKFWLVTKHNRKLLQKHVQDIVVTRQDIFLLTLLSKCIFC